MIKSTYTITEWSDEYETAESRKLETMRWVPFPISTDGLLFKRIAKQKNRSELLAAMVLMLQVAGRSRRGNRGSLTFNGRPLDASDMTLLTGWPESTFEAAFAFFSSEEVGWLKVNPPPAANPPAQSPATPAASPATPADSPSTPPPTAGAIPIPPEGGQVGQGGQDKVGDGRDDTPPAATPSRKGKPESFGEVEAFIEESGIVITPVAAAKFFNHFEANGWVQGRGKPIRDWRAALRNWVLNESAFSAPKNSVASAAPAAGQIVSDPVIFK